MLSKEQRDKTRKMHGIISRKDTVVIALLNTCDELEKERDNERKGYASLRARFDFISQKAEQRRDQVIGEMAENAALVEAGKAIIPFVVVHDHKESWIFDIFIALLESSLEPCLECGLPTLSPPHLVNGRCPANPDEVEV